MSALSIGRLRSVHCILLGLGIHLLWKRFDVVRRLSPGSSASQHARLNAVLLRKPQSQNKTSRK